MSDLGVPIPVLTPSGTGNITARPPSQPSSRPVEANGQAAPGADGNAESAEGSPADPITGPPTAGLSAGLAVVLQNLETETNPGNLGNSAPLLSPDTGQLEFQPIDPVEATVEALTDPTPVPVPGQGTGQVAAQARAIVADAPATPRSPAQATGSEGASEGEEEAGAGQQAIPSGSEDVGPDGLTEEERRVVAELQRVDAEVRRHEQAHAAVGGPYAGAPAYQTVRGPDGRLYAVGGEVQIDVSDIPGNPEATIRKLQIVRRAALAPATPSAADRRVASIAQQGIAEARQELREQRVEEREAASEAREESALRREQLQPTDSISVSSPSADLTPLRLGIPTLVRSSGPFVNPSQILSVIA